MSKSHPIDLPFPDTTGIERAIAAAALAVDRRFIVSAAALRELGLGIEPAFNPIDQGHNAGYRFCRDVAAEGGGRRVTGGMLAGALRVARAYLLAGQAYYEQTRRYSALACSLNQQALDLPADSAERHLARIEQCFYRAEKELEAGEAAVQAAKAAFLLYLDAAQASIDRRARAASAA